jgi:hypothetical protein
MSLSLRWMEVLALFAGCEIVVAQSAIKSQQAVLFALRALTGRDAGTSIRAWRKVLGAIRQERNNGAPAAGA